MQKRIVDIDGREQMPDGGYRGITLRATYGESDESAGKHVLLALEILEVVPGSEGVTVDASPQPQPQPETK